MSIFDYTSRLIARFHGGVVERKDVEIANISNPVYYVHDSDWGSAGQGIAFTHILINLAQTEAESQLMHDYVYLHEAGHKQWSWMFQFFFTLGQMVYLIILLILVVALPSYLIGTLQQPTIELKAFSLLSIPIVYGILICIPLSVTWLDEGLAELFSISHLGRDTYRQVIEEKAQKNHGISPKIRKYVMYPPDRIVLAVARWQDIG